MNKDEIKKYVKSKMGVVPADLQRAFGLNYIQTKEVIDEMIEEGCLVYESGVRYVYVRTFDERFAEYMERHDKQELIDFWGVPNPEGNWQLEVKLRCMALRLVINEQAASPSLLQRNLPVGYGQSSVFIAWMEGSGFISEQRTGGREVYITREQLEALIDDKEDASGNEDASAQDGQSEEQPAEQTAEQPTDDKDGADGEIGKNGENAVVGGKWRNPFADKDELDFSDKVDLRGMPMSDDDWDDYDEEDYLDHSDDNGDDGDDDEDYDVDFGDDDDYDDDDFFDDDDDDLTTFEKQNEMWDEAIAEFDAKLKDVMTRMVVALNKIAERKAQPITADVMPKHSLWADEAQFTREVMLRMERIILSDKKLGLQGAIKKAETYLEAVRDTHDGMMVQVYERLVYEFKNTSEYLYRQLKKQYFGDE